MKMRSLLTMIVMTLTVSLFLSSCGGKDPIIPGGGNGDNGHENCWTYEIGVYSLNDITPALDESDNIYLSMADMETNSVVVVSLDKDGNERWKNTIEATGSTSDVAFYNGKVFVPVSDPVGVYCYDAASGSLLWNRNLTDDYDFIYMPQLVITNNKIYLFSGQTFYAFLLSLDLDGNELYVKQLPSDGTVMAAVGNGNNLYFNDGDYLYCYTDNGNVIDSTWAVHYYDSKFKSTEFISPFLSMPIDNDGNIYIREEKIWIVSPQGTLIRTIELGNSFDRSTSDILLSGDGDIFIANNDGNLIKMSNDGTVIWTTDIHDGIIVNPFFSRAAIISDNGTMYDGQTFGLYSVKDDGTLNWKINSETGAGIEFGNLHPPVLTHDGNLIIVSGEQKKVRCFKGDGHKLATSGWPKMYGNYGNTNAK